MISDRAKKSIDHIFVKSATAWLRTDAGDSCAIESIARGGTGEMPEKQIVVLTISSILFRLLTIFHIDETATTRGYFMKDAADQSFGDVFSEIGNLCCGAMNRELINHFPHLGLSTPYTLSSRCMAFLDELKPGHVSRFAITINDTVHFHATVCMCEYAPIDFVVDMTTVEEATGGLELF